MSKIDKHKLHLYNCYFDINDYNKPYENTLQFLEDLRYLVDSYVNAMFRIKKSNSRDNAKYLGLRGVVITDDEVDNSIMASMLENRSIKVGEDIKTSLLTSFEHIKNRVSISNSSFSLHNFFVKHNCNFVTKLAIVFSLVSEIDRKYERLFGYLQDDNTVKKPTLGLVFSAASLTHNISLEETFELLDNKLTSLLFEDIALFDFATFLSKGLKLKKTATDFFLENKKQSFIESMVCDTYFPHEDVDTLIVDIDVNRRLFSQIQKILDQKLKDNIIHISGPSGSGKRLQVKHIAKSLNKKVLFVNLRYVLQFEARTVILLSNIYLDAFLNDGLLCFYNCNFEASEQNNLEIVLNDVFQYFDLVFLLSEKSRYFDDNSDSFLPVVSAKLNFPNITDAAVIWKENSKNYKIDKQIDFRQISNKFKYTAGQIKDILLKSNIANLDKDGIISEELLIKTCREYAIHNLDKRASLINCHFTFDDLVLSKDQKDILVNACNYIKYKDVIYEDWGFKNKVSYGKGLSVLLYGPPGTGKTMGAQVIANELGLQLYKIDLAQIINKYIGETEKNLNDIFSEAQKSNAVLLFDEADSLFGKRTDVKDSNDKNSNNETSYLLQKMEEYDGISILTTNKFNNFDEAFRRRIRFIVSFPMPDAKMRRELWKKVFPKQAPLAHDFDDWFLAENFEISGSVIKSIAILASYMAVADKTEITMKHILSALKYELQKSGKVISKQDFGVYGNEF